MILVGRMIDCKLRFDDNSISRYQCSIYFQNDVGWTICDGIDDKKSMNGTWLYVDSSFEILQGMVFRTGKTLFEMGLIL